MNFFLNYLFLVGHLNLHFLIKKHILLLKNIHFGGEKMSNDLTVQDKVNTDTIDELIEMGVVENVYYKDN